MAPTKLESPLTGRMVQISPRANSAFTSLMHNAKTRATMWEKYAKQLTAAGYARGSRVGSRGKAAVHKAHRTLKGSMRGSRGKAAGHKAARRTLKGSMRAVKTHIQRFSDKHAPKVAYVKAKVKISLKKPRRSLKHTAGGLMRSLKKAGKHLAAKVQGRAKPKAQGKRNVVHRGVHTAAGWHAVNKGLDRNRLPHDCFLEPARKKYPICGNDGRVDCRGVLAAVDRARINAGHGIPGAAAVLAHAKTIYARECK